VAAVENGAQHPVVILYEHALLGEGIARYLRAQSGVEATVASAHDLEAVKSALAYGPAVVIFELSDALRQVDLSTLAPDAVLIDVSTVVARGSANPPGVAGLEKILQAVRCSNSTVSLSAESPPGGTLSAPAR
jgi:DNA-binding NarL/FixJ family response regulator